MSAAKNTGRQAAFSTFMSFQRNGGAFGMLEHFGKVRIGAEFAQQRDRAGVRAEGFLLKVEDVFSDLAGGDAEGRLAEAIFDVEFGASIDEELDYCVIA